MLEVTILTLCVTLMIMVMIRKGIQVTMKNLKIQVRYFLRITTLKETILEK